MHGARDIYIFKYVYLKKRELRLVFIFRFWDHDIQTYFIFIELLD